MQLFCICRVYVIRGKSFSTIMLNDRHTIWAAPLTTLPRLDPDLALVRQFRATASSAAFEILFRKYQSPVFNLVHRMVNGEDAYDLTQEVFYRALRSLTTFQGDCKFRTWLYTIARNVCLNYLREKKVRAGLEGVSLDAEDDQPGYIPEPADPLADVPQIVEVRELQRVVDRVLAAMPPEQRLLITLRDLEGLSYEEIAQITEITLINVKSKLHRARQSFKVKFQPYLENVDPNLDLEVRSGGTEK
jgi:RNA polymerase sigma-70 factor (ECF subfamily)